MLNDLSNEDIKKYLPQFLSGSSKDDLFSCLADFPENIDHRIYSDIVINFANVLQGDGLDGLLFVKWPSKQFQPVPSMILSNSCDIALENPRVVVPYVCYCPLISYSKYVEKLREKGKDTSDFERDVKAQRLTSMFYLPKGQCLEEDKIVLLDRMQSCPNDDPIKLKAKKVFSLSNYGFYLFLLKISIHFTRIKDGIDRIPIAT